MFLLMLFQVRDPMPAVFFFLVDVSMNAIQTGATAAACSAISQVIADLPVSLFPDFSCDAFYSRTFHKVNEELQAV